VYNEDMKYQQIGSHFAELSAALLSVDREELRKAIELLKKAKQLNSRVWIVGNGGSAATAAHFANDLVKMGGLRAMALPAQVPTVTAFGNDEGWEYMFSHALDVFQSPQDVLVAISCSGASRNVLEAARGVENLIVLTGNNLQSPLCGFSTKAFLHAASDDITIQEDIHLAICHAIAKALG